MAATGEIPSSSALTEASQIDSLAEAISRFDSQIQAGSQNSSEAKQALAQIVSGLREQRVRWEAAEASKPARARGSGVKAPLSRKVAGKAEDLGL